nr:hypothetical protein JVH1_8728 [Rhodococcus sp. JVH1]
MAAEDANMPITSEGCAFQDIDSCRRRRTSRTEGRGYPVGLGASTSVKMHWRGRWRDGERRNRF